MASRLHMGAVIAADAVVDKVEAMLSRIPSLRIVSVPEKIFSGLSSTETPQGRAGLVRLKEWTLEDLTGSTPSDRHPGWLAGPWKRRRGRAIRGGLRRNRRCIPERFGPRAQPEMPPRLGRVDLPGTLGTEGRSQYRGGSFLRPTGSLPTPRCPALQNPRIQADLSVPCALVIGGEAHGVGSVMESGGNLRSHSHLAAWESLNEAAVAAAVTVIRSAAPEGGPHEALFDASPLPHIGCAWRFQAPSWLSACGPNGWSDFAGQQHILGSGKPLRIQIERDPVAIHDPLGTARRGQDHPGPPGRQTMSKSEFVPFSAVLAGIKEIKAVMADAEKLRKMGRRTVLFVDEIHRFNKAQQDAFLPYVERGDIILIGATTENPSFEIVSALLSRTKVYALRALSVPEIVSLLERALPVIGVQAEPELLEQIAKSIPAGDARTAYNILDLASTAARDGKLEKGSRGIGHGSQGPALRQSGRRAFQPGLGSAQKRPILRP